MNEVLENTIQFCKGVGPKRAELFEKIGVRRVCDLLRFYPRNYIDYSDPVSLSAAPAGEISVIRGRVVKKNPPARIRKGMTLYKVLITDDFSDGELTFFNTPIPSRMLKEGETFRFRGKVEGSLLRRTISSPTFVPEGKAQELVPVYPKTAGLSDKVIGSAAAYALSLFDASAQTDPIPEKILRQEDLMGLHEALHAVHAPTCREELAKARRRLAFEELLILQLGLIQLRGSGRSAPCAEKFSDDNWSEFLDSLPFVPTRGQMQAVKDCLDDIASGYPMNRLLQGDVGSGKTLVAAVLSFLTAKNGRQAVIMAPTEILARQHLASFEKLFAPFGITCGLLCGSMTQKEKNEVKRGTCDGSVQILIGTHALLQDDVTFHDLFLTVTDEQHRFGVAQRALLRQKAPGTHHLVLSATPIPRTLGLILYGDLDISVIREKPPGRQPISTHLVPEKKREGLYRFLSEKIDMGQQIYIVCPLIDSEEEHDEIGSAVAYRQMLSQTVLRDRRIGLMHGKLKPAEKDDVMDRFRRGELDILVSTTVIEVGVDVPGATVMVIEEAHRFGLSQLHQLRGRVGRGSTESYCFLLSKNCPDSAKERLKFLASCNDGFKIAEYDLEQRGPGNFFGFAQHGLPDLKIAPLMTDTRSAESAARHARTLSADDPCLESPENRLLGKAVSDLFSAVGGALD